MVVPGTVPVRARCDEQAPVVSAHGVAGAYDICLDSHPSACNMISGRDIRPVVPSLRVVPFLSVDIEMSVAIVPLPLPQK